MVIKIYCLVLFGGEYEDMQMTLSQEKALDWMKKKPKTRYILEYWITENGISDMWECVWRYDDDGKLWNYE